MKTGFGVDAVLVHAVLDQVDAEVDEPAHLDRAAERDLAVALGEVQVAARQLRAVDVDRVVHAASTSEVLDVVVAAVLPRGHGARALARDLRQVAARQRPGQRVVLERRQRQRRHAVRVGVDQGLLAPVPLRQQVRRRRGAEQPGMGDTRVADARDVARGRLLAAEVPDRLVGIREVVGQEAAAVRPVEDARVAPSLAGRVALLLRRLAGAQLEDVDHEQVPCLRSLDRDRAAEHVRAGEIHIAHVVGRVVVADLRVRPLAAFDPEVAAGAHRRDAAGMSGCQRLWPGTA